MGGRKGRGSPRAEALRKEADREIPRYSSGSAGDLIPSHVRALVRYFSVRAIEVVLAILVCAGIAGHSGAASKRGGKHYEDQATSRTTSATNSARLSSK